MTTALLAAKQHLPVRFQPARRTTFIVFVEAATPVWVFFVDEQGYADFCAGRSFKTAGPLSPAEQHRFTVRVHDAGCYWLLIVNDADIQTAIHYNVRRR